MTNGPLSPPSHTVQHSRCAPRVLSEKTWRPRANRLQEYLAPRGEDNAEFLSELEQTVALLAFEDHTGSPLGSLLDVSHRQKAASEVNAALMAAQDMASNARLSGLVSRGGAGLRDRPGLELCDRLHVWLARLLPWSLSTR